MNTEFLIDQVLGILATASISSLVALGLVVSFRLMGVINLAHGQFLMVGAYAAVMLSRAGFPFWLGIAVAGVIGFVIGALVEIVIIRRFYGTPELAILGTFGLGIVLSEIAEILFGSGYQQIANPLPGAVSLGSIDFPVYRIFLIAAALLLFAVMIVLLSRTRLGVRVRAVATDTGLAGAVGVNATRLKLIVFSLSTAFAAVAGALVAPTTNVEPSMGMDYLFIAFVVVIVGGSRLSVVLLASLLLAVLQNVVTISLSGMVANLALLLAALVVLAASKRQFKGYAV